MVLIKSIGCEKLSGVITGCDMVTNVTIKFHVNKLQKIEKLLFRRKHVQIHRHFTEQQLFMLKSIATLENLQMPVKPQDVQVNSMRS